MKRRQFVACYPRRGDTVGEIKENQPGKWLSLVDFGAVGFEIVCGGGCGLRRCLMAKAGTAVMGMQQRCDLVLRHCSFLVDK